MYYVLLAGAATVAAAIAFQRTERKAALVAAYFFSMSGVLLADWVAWGWFRLYEYHPSLASSPVVDAIWGEFLGDILTVPGLTVTMLSVDHLLGMVLVGTSLVTVLEWLFIRAGLFSLNGWATWMTTFAFPVYFWAVYRFHGAATAHGVEEPKVRTALRVALLVCAVATMTLLLRGFDTTVINLHLMPTFIQDQSLGRFLIYIPILVGSGLWVMAGPRHSRLLAVTLGLVVWNYLLTATGIREFHWPWAEPVDALAQGLTIGVACLLEHWILQLEQMERRPTFNR